MLLYLGCYIALFPCEPTTGNALPLCLESCNEFDMLIQNMELDGQDIPTDLVYQFQMLSCSNPSSYIAAYTHVDFSQCIDPVELGK